MIDMQLVCINQLYFSGSPARVDDMGRSRQRKPHPSTALPGCVPVEVQEMELDTLYGYVAKAQRELLNDAEAKALHASLQTLGVLMEELKRKGPGSKRDMMTAGRIGEGAIALGCIGAAATGNVALGLPCVVGGAVTSAALRTWSGQ